MPNDRLSKKLLLGEVSGLRPPGRPRSRFNDVTLHDCQYCRISRPYRDAQDRLLWIAKTCPARTYLIKSWKALLLLSFISIVQASPSQLHNRTLLVCILEWQYLLLPTNTAYATDVCCF